MVSRWIFGPKQGLNWAHIRESSSNLKTEPNSHTDRSTEVDQDIFDILFNIHISYIHIISWPKLPSGPTRVWISSLYRPFSRGRNSLVKVEMKYPYLSMDWANESVIQRKYCIQPSTKQEKIVISSKWWFKSEQQQRLHGWLQFR